MSAANGPSCHDMMNRVMTKDNIGLVALLETKEEIYSHTFSNGKNEKNDLINVIIRIKNHHGRGDTKTSNKFECID
jgi:hypothetical protein